MLPPMRPKPIMPSCIWPCPVIVSCERSSNGVLESRQTGCDMHAKMDAQDTPAALGQYLEVAARLRRLDDTKSIFVTRNIHIGGIVAGYLKEHAGIRPALVGLARRMKKSRPEPEAGSDTLAVANHEADLVQCVTMLLVTFDIGEE